MKTRYHRPMQGAANDCASHPRTAGSWPPLALRILKGGADNRGDCCALPFLFFYTLLHPISVKKMSSYTQNESVRIYDGQNNEQENN